ncbi:MAG: HU family DNA-binding protein, partial [bacterium]|nr:HU family DNA-binding protein [bacterium]
ARKGRNPQNGKALNIPARRVVRFRTGSELKGRVK